MKMAHFSLSGIIQLSRGPDIPDLFEKKLFTLFWARIVTLADELKL